MFMSVSDRICLLQIFKSHLFVCLYVEGAACAAEYVEVEGEISTLPCASFDGTPALQEALLFLQSYNK